jgi:hypothetical protein
MKVIIAGSRGVTDKRFIELAIKEAGFEITEVVSGGARGPDRMGEDWAKQHFCPVKVFFANWLVHGRSAGMLRNTVMANYADALIAIWDGKSKGTKHMIWTAEKKGLKVFVLNVSDPKRTPPLPDATTGEYN